MRAESREKIFAFTSSFFRVSSSLRIDDFPFEQYWHLVPEILLWSLILGIVSRARYFVTFIRLNSHTVGF